MKKLTSLLMVLCLAAFAVGCGEKTETTTEKANTDKAANTDNVDNDGDGIADEAGEASDVDGSSEGGPAAPPEAANEG